jgi:DNA-binding response OmpR family regulator
MSYVLVIEDDQSISDTILIYCSYKVVECYSYDCYNSVVECVKEHGDPSLVLLDYVIDTEKIVQFLRKYKLKIVLITARGNAKFLFQKLDVDYLLEKPFNLDDLDELLKII